MLVLASRKKKFYEFGFTLYEKIFYFNFFNKFFSKKINLKNIQFNGTEISSQFIFFCQNFYKGLSINVSKNIKKSYFLNSVFFAKGVILLYEKKNIKYLNNFIKKCESGNFDISIYSKKKIVTLETGYKLYFPSKKDFVNLMKNSKKKFYYRNKKNLGDKLYLEVLFGKKGLDKKINNQLSHVAKNRQNIDFKRFLALNEKFKELKLSHLR